MIDNAVNSSLWSDYNDSNTGKGHELQILYVSSKCYLTH
jgi:hypothetical protein